MRKRKEKFSAYTDLLTPNFISPIPPEPKETSPKLPKLKVRSTNFFRVGCPTEALIHIPQHMATLKLESQSDTAQAKGSVKDLIEKIHEKPQKTSSFEKWKEKESIKLPIKSFKEVKLPSQFFSLDSVPQVDPCLSKVMRKVNSGEVLKPLSTRAQEIKDRFVISHDFLFDSKKSPYFTSPFCFSS